MSKDKYVIGVDFGSDSCRALLVNALTGEEMSVSVSNYRRWSRSEFCNPNLNEYRQHPLDYLESLKEVLLEVVKSLSFDERKNILSIACDATASTPVIVNENGIPLSLLPEFSDEPDAMFVLWKDHSAAKEAEEINALSHSWKIDYTEYSGGIYSAEWVWAKVMHIIRKNDNVYKSAYSWVEFCDWIPAVLTGNTKPETMKRNRCVAGHKAMWNKQWGGLPEMAFFEKIEPKMKCFSGHLYNKTVCNETIVGTLTAEWAELLGLSTDVVVGMGGVDAHIGAVGAGISPGMFVRVMGTSTCDMMVVPECELNGKCIKGICGQVDDAILTGFVGLEAGQSAFGDVYSWFNRLVAGTMKNMSIERNFNLSEGVLNKLSSSFLSYISDEAEKIPTDDNSVVALDWFNGRRTPFANQRLKGGLFGLTLGTSAAHIYRALIEATAFGSKAIVDSIKSQGVRIESILAIGGISHKSPFVMQVLADVLGCPIHVSSSTQTCALGSAIIAATAAGIYENVEMAQKKMSPEILKTYFPDEELNNIYANKYDRYVKFGDYAEKNLSLVQ